MKRLFISLALTVLAASPAISQELNDQLIAASRKSDVALARTLLEKGASVDAKTQYGATPLFFACDRGSVEMVKLLLEKGANVDIRDTFYKASPTAWAAQKGHSEVVRLLLQKHPKGRDEAMSVGIESGFPAIVKVVLDLGGLSQDSLNNYLTMATRSQAPAIVELLKAAGAKPIVLTEVKVAPEVLQGYVGTYRNERVAYSLLVKDTKLVIRIAPQREFSLTCTAAHTFESPEVPGVKLVFGAEGEKVTSLTVKEPSGDTLLKKVEVK